MDNVKITVQHKREELKGKLLRSKNLLEICLYASAHNLQS